MNVTVSGCLSLNDRPLQDVPCLSPGDILDRFQLTLKRRRVIDGWEMTVRCFNQSVTPQKNYCCAATVLKPTWINHRAISRLFCSRLHNSKAMFNFTLVHFL